MCVLHPQHIPTSHISSATWHVISDYWIRECKSRGRGKFKYQLGPLIAMWFWASYLNSVPWFSQSRKWRWYLLRTAVRIEQDNQGKHLASSKCSMNMSCYYKHNYFCFSVIIVTATISIEKMNHTSQSLDFSQNQIHYFRGQRELGKRQLKE